MDYSNPKGLLVADYLHAQVWFWFWDGEEEQASCWHILVCREVGVDDIPYYCLSNVSLDTPWQELARVQANNSDAWHLCTVGKTIWLW